MRAFWEKIKAGFSFVMAAVVAVLSSPGLANAVYQLFVQFWQGFSRVLDPEVVPYLARAKNSRAVLARSAYINIVLYAGVVLFYEAGMRNLLRYGMPAMEDSWAEYGLDLFVRTCLNTLFLVDNIMLNAGIQQAARLDSTGLENDCDHETTKKIQSRLASVLYYGGNSAALSLIEWRDPAAANWVLRPMFYGRYFVEQAAGGRMCTDDRNVILNRNNPYTFGMGLSFLLILSLACYVVNVGLKRIVNVESRYVNDAIFYLLFQYFLMLAYSTKKPLPGWMPGVDVALPGRVATRYVLQTTVDTITPLLGDPAEELDWVSIEKKLNDYAKMMVTNQAMIVMQYILFGAEWSSREAFLRKPIPMLLFPMFERIWRGALQDTIKWCDSTRRKGTAVNVVHWFEWMMGVELIPEYKKTVVKLVSINEFMEFLKRFETYLDWVKAVQGVGRDKESDKEEHRDRALKFVERGTPALMSASTSVVVKPSSQPQAIFPGAARVPAPATPTAADAAITLTTAAATAVITEEQSASSLTTTASATAATSPSLTPAPVLPVEPARNMSEVAATLKAIASLPRWDQVGVAYFGTKTPGHVEKIRAITEGHVDIHKLYNLIKSELESNQGGVGRATMTSDFYTLIKKCFDSRHDANSCYKLIAGFVSDYHFRAEERKSIDLEPQGAQVALRR